MAGMFERMLDGYRQDAGMSWTEVASKVGISEEGLRLIRKGKNRPKASTARKLENVLGIHEGTLDDWGAMQEGVQLVIELPRRNYDSDSLLNLKALVEDYARYLVERGRY